MCEPLDDAMLAEVRAHDEAVARAAPPLWVGAEPTFTDRASQEAWWLGQAEGGDKEVRARELLHGLVARLGAAAPLLKVRGRLYPGEEEPRFCLGALLARDGGPLTPSPTLSPSPALSVPLSPLDGEREREPPLLPAPLPAAGEAWWSVTPDPGVVEVNMAPAPDLATFARWCDAVYAAAHAAGLSAVRLRYNGEATDSGGGGQLTLGGPSPRESPFFARPQLLPRLVRYANRHPSLSYLFAPACVGSASQGPRADEGVRERFEELPVALDRLAARGDTTTPEELWSTLAPLLVDSAGNSHRAELNVEKLWNPWTERGRLGLVELRALRMPPTSARLVAVAALFRAVAARLAAAPYDEPLVDWGGSLHELFGLPWFLHRDLDALLEDLAQHGLAPGERLQAELRRGEEEVAALSLGGARLEVAPARAFWPLLGDVASQERSGARLVDSSASRLQLLVTTPGAAAPGAVHANGWRVALHEVAAAPRRHLASVVYRSFTPSPGLHPGLAPDDPLHISWELRGERAALSLHGWKPDGGAYDGLPRDEAEARARRRERAVVEVGQGRAPATSAAPAAGPRAGLTLDLRRVAGPGLAPAPPRGLG